MAHWTEDFLKIEYKNKNCSEFVAYVLYKKFGLITEFPKANGNVFEQSNLIRSSIPKFCEETSNPEDGALVLMSGNRRLSHVGVYVQIKGIGYVLHTESTMTTAALQRLSDLSISGYTVEGFYRWL